MIAAWRATTSWLAEIAAAWNRFWFRPQAPHALAAIRVLGGAMLFYTHLVWTLDLDAFLGADGWLTEPVVSSVARTPFSWSHLWWLKSSGSLWAGHIAALVVFALFAAGFWTRATGILSAVLTLSYCHRLQGALYGLDQVNAMLAIYLAIGPAGDVYSIDRWRLERWLKYATPPVRPSVGAAIAIRLIQVHLSIVYLFGGISKLKGTMWWDGSAVWYAIANYEYQTFDMTWLGHWPWLIAILTHITVFWETFYPVLVWPRLTRPIMLALAVAVHGGIAVCLGMPTFGLAMIIANLAFVSPELIQQWVALPRRWLRRDAAAPAKTSRR